MAGKRLENFLKDFFATKYMLLIFIVFRTFFRDRYR